MARYTVWKPQLAQLVAPARVENATRTQEDGVSGARCELHNAGATERRDALRTGFVHVPAGAELASRPGTASKHVAIRFEKERVLTSRGAGYEAPHGWKGFWHGMTPPIAVAQLPAPARSKAVAVAARQGQGVALTTRDRRHAEAEQPDYDARRVACEFG